MAAEARYIDGHCHLADPRLAGELDRIVSEAYEQGIGAFVQGGVDPGDWDRQLALKARFPGKIVTSFGLHPWWVAAHTEAEFSGALALLERRVPEADGFGEIGLDFGQKRPSESHALQMAAFEGQLGLARTSGKPLVLHVVHAHSEALRLLRASGFSSASGLVHSFSASREIAREYLDLGLSLSISGVITRKGFETLKRAVSYIPADRLILETDSPDQAPSDWKGSLNELRALFQVAEAVSRLRGEKDPTAILEASAANVRRIFQR